jgi:hypothetical protein
MTSSATDAVLEETWWEVTTTTGLILTLPAPLKRTGETVAPVEALTSSGRFHACSAITNMMYGVDLTHALFIRQFTKTHDPERLLKSQMRASQTASSPSSDAGPAPSSRSGARTSPRGR